MTAVAVLGATGGVGRYVCEALSDSGFDVLAIARQHAPHLSDYKFAALDVAVVPPSELASVLSEVSAVVNATGGWVTTESEQEYSHVRLVHNLIAATALVPGRPRLIQIGSIHEYGKVPSGVPIDEWVVPAPTTSYARTKLAGSVAVLDAHREGLIDAVVLRAVNICGPHSTAASFLGFVVEKLRTASPGQRLELTVADARRDFLDVRDLASAVVLAATAPVSGMVLNLGRGEAVDMRELVLQLVAAAGQDPSIVSEHAGSQVESKGGGWTQADITLARHYLDWTPRISLPDSLRDMWQAALSKELP